MSKVGDILKSLRVKESLTQEELAKILKMPRSTIGMYEQGKRVPPTEVLEEFADFYNVDMNYITGQTDEEYYLDLQARQIAQESNGHPPFMGITGFFVSCVLVVRIFLCDCL